MGVTGIHAEAGLTTGDYEEASVKRAFSRRAAETIVLASAEKINAASSYVIGELAMVNTMVVEEEADAGLIAALEKAGVVVVKAD
jgi:DeoR/GlpR family transcriptional regulator of sugar metabolism